MSRCEEASERAVERLSFFMLKDAYTAAARLLMKTDSEAAFKLFEAIERQAEGALQRIHEQKSEGSASTSIATAIAERLVSVFDAAHAEPLSLRSSEGVITSASATNSSEPAGSIIANALVSRAANNAA